MKYKRVALVCANVGKFDPVFPVPAQLYGAHDVHYFTEQNLPFPLPNLNDRLKSKYVKIMTHRFLPDYDIYVWMDGSVEVISPTFISNMVAMLGHDDIAISLHHERKTVYEEIDYILSNIEAGKEYLIKRYANEPLAEETVFYKNSHMPDDAARLYITRFFVRKNTERVNACFNDWWNGCLEFANFDQTMFTYASWKHGLNIRDLDYLGVVDNLIRVHKH